jgi:hypothetical protein
MQKNEGFNLGPTDYEFATRITPGILHLLLSASDAVQRIYA